MISEAYKRVRRGAYLLERSPRIRGRWETEYHVTGELTQAQLQESLGYCIALGWSPSLYVPVVAISDLYCVSVDGWKCELSRDRWAVFPDGTSAEATFTAGGRDVNPFRAIEKALRRAEWITKEDPDFQRLYMDV